MADEVLKTATELAKRAIWEEEALHALIKLLKGLGANEEDLKKVKEMCHRYSEDYVTGDEAVLAAFVLGIIDRLRGEARDPDEVWELVGN